MKNYEELFKALLAGETLRNVNKAGESLRLSNGTIDRYRDEVWTETDVEIIDLSEWDFATRTKNINGVEVPTPRKTAPATGQEYFTPTVNNASGYRDYIWRGSASDTRRLKAGVIHLEPEHAAQHTKAILSLTAG